MIYHCKLLESKRLQYQRNTRTRSSGLSWITSSTITIFSDEIRSYYERYWNVPVKVERKCNANGTGMERIYERVPVAFRTHFLLGYF